MKYLSIASVISNSEITPSRNGRIATISLGVRPTISRASDPIANGRRVRLLIATQEGSLITMPLSRIATSVFAVPKSIPMSNENSPNSQSSGLNNARPSSFSHYIIYGRLSTIVLYNACSCQTNALYPTIEPSTAHLTHFAK